MIENVYCFDDLGQKIKVGEYDDGIYPVGGRIFYIEDNKFSDEVVEFYDAQGNVLQNVGVGDSPASYKIVDPGTKGKDKYFVFDTTYTLSYTGKFYWTYMKDGSWVYEDTDTDDNHGSGKANTLKVMAIRNGEYITDHADSSSQDPTETIWWYIDYMNTHKIGGCDDWYIGSYQDNKELRTFMTDPEVSIALDYGLDYGLLASVDYEQDITHAYAVKDVSGTYMYDKKDSTHKGCAIRSF